MKDELLKYTDPEDLEDLFLKVETSFNVKFTERELAYINSFGELCDYIGGKIQLENSDDCTSQQAFYKLREAVSNLLYLEKKAISPELKLSELFPRKNRRVKIKELGKQLDLTLNLLHPPYWLSRTLAIILFFSFVGLFFNWQLCLLGIVLSIFGFWISAKLGNEFDLETLGQIAEKMMRDSYLKSRRNPKTFNKNEIERVLTELFINDLNLDKSKLTRDTAFT